MINHLRTLLLNADGRSGPTLGAIGEEYVPAEYRPVQTTESIEIVRRACFGRKPDRSLVNYRLRQLLTMLHATDLEQYVLQLDSRTTYLPFQTDELFTDAFRLNVRTTVAPTLGQAGLPDLLSILFVFPMSAHRPSLQEQLDVPETLFPQYDETLPLAMGEQPLVQAWKVVNDGSSVLIYRRAPGHDVAPSVTEPLVYGGNGLSQMVRLPDSDIGIRLRSDSANGQWEIKTARRPTGNLADILMTLRGQLAGAYAAELFGPFPTGDYRVFADLWYGNRQLPYQLGAAVLAAAYRMDEARQLNQLAR